MAWTFRNGYSEGAAAMAGTFRSGYAEGAATMAGTFREGDSSSRGGTQEKFGDFRETFGDVREDLRKGLSAGSTAVALSTWLATHRHMAATCRGGNYRVP